MKRPRSYSLLRAVCCTAQVLILTLVGVAAHAQEPVRIQGNVVDVTTQSPLTSVSVTLRGTSYGALTDGTGRYTLAVRIAPGSYTLDFNLIGRLSASQEISVGTSLAVNVPSVEMRETVVELGGLVVTGTGVATQQRALGNAVTVVSGDAIANSRATTIDAALAGKIPGAQIMMNSGTPGGGVSVRLRGTSSIISGAEPLYIVDGVIIDNSSDQQIDFGYRSNPSNRLADLNPNDIERVEVLKGAAAAALYGSRANNGVIQIFTKRGAAGQTRITLSSRATLGQVQGDLPFNMFPLDSAGGTAITRYDHQDLVFRDAWGNETTAAISGGADQTRFYLSASYLNDQGIMIGAASEKISARLNVDQTVNDWLSVRGGANYVRTNNDLVRNGENGSGGILTAIVFSPTDVDFSAKDPETGQYVVRATTFPNPLEVIDFWNAPQTVNRFIGSFQARATPTSFLTVEYRLGYDTYNMDTGLFIPRGTPSVAPLGSSTSVARSQYLINNDVIASYAWGAEGFQMTTTGGMNHTYSREETITASVTDLLPTTQLVRGAAPSASQNRFETATLGFFAQQQVGIDDQLFVTGALRWDASSTFGPDERWQLYPKLSASYVLSALDGWADSFLGFAQDLRLRGALGYAGNQPPVGSAYARFPRYTGETNINRSGLVHLADQGNPNLKPERQREYELGLDASFFGDRLGLGFTYYNQYVKDLLLSRPFEPSTGYGNVLDNVGELTNRGIELQLTSRNIDRTGLGWNSSFTFSRNRNRVERLAGDPFTQGYFNRVLEGEPLGSWFLFDWQYNADGSIRLDAGGLPLRDSVRTIIGDPNPDFQASLRNEVRFGTHVTVSLLLDGVFGHDVWNQTLRIMDRFRAGPLYERQLRGEVTEAYRLRHFTNEAQYLEDGTFVKVREIGMSYNVPQTFADRLGMQSLTLEVAGRNLYTFTDYSGYDPETNMFGTSTVARGTDFATYPIPRTFSFGFRSVF
jgi:TonB-dependent SusC/RagA subfamily outer membrane receptor